MITFCILIALNIINNYIKNIDLAGISNYFQNTSSGFIEFSDSEQNIQVINEEWKITIPKIELEASIEEGVTSEVLSKYIGHLDTSGSISGNICLKAYSSGNNVNYFKNIKSLRAGDEIFYKKDDLIITFVVEFSGVIDYEDTSYLSQDDENKITLITNIENENKYLRCVQATAKQKL